MSYYPDQEPNELFWAACILIMTIALWGWLCVLTTGIYP